MEQTYIVQEGDTILSIAQMYGVRVIDIISLNNLEDVYYLEPGMQIMIPNSAPKAFTYYMVQKGDTLYKIASMYNISLNDLVEMNGLENPNFLYVGQKLLVPKEGVNVYITKPGDTLNVLSSKFRVNPDDLLLYNDRLYLLPEQLIAYKVNKNEQ